MTTKYNTFKGKLKYARIATTDDYGNYVVALEMDEDSLEKFRASGIRVAIKDNTAYFRRPDKKLIKDDLVTYGPPIVDDDNKRPITGLIGTDSEATIGVRSYSTTKGVGHTLDHIRIHKLVEVPFKVGYDFD